MDYNKLSESEFQALLVSGHPFSDDILNKRGFRLVEANGIVDVFERKGTQYPFLQVHGNNYIYYPVIDLKP